MVQIVLVGNRNLAFLILNSWS